MGNYGKALETFACFGDICNQEKIIPFFIGDLNKIYGFFNQEFKISQEAIQNVFDSCVISDKLFFEGNSLYYVSRDAKLTVETLLKRKLNAQAIQRGEIFHGNFLCDKYGNFNEKTFISEEG